jgi:hypothetical protein
MNVAVRTLEKLQGLERLYRQGFRSDVVDQTIAKLLDLEVQRARSEQQDLEARMAEYETQYQMRSEAFYQRFRAGELGDAMDFVEWSVFYEMHQVLSARLETLGGAPE